jgi:hypothetical protein
MSTIIYQPYTYLIGWSAYNLWYYGCEFATVSKIANPNNLWNTYFTSSTYVLDVRKKHGEPDIVQVRHVFNNVDDCVKWEKKVLSRMNVLNDDRWLNKNIYGSIVQDEAVRRKISVAKKGKKHTDESKHKMSVSRKGKKHSEETKRKMSATRKGKKRGPYKCSRKSPSD